MKRGILAFAMVVYRDITAFMRKRHGLPAMSAWSWDAHDINATEACMDSACRESTTAQTMHSKRRRWAIWDCNSEQMGLLHCSATGSRAWHGRLCGMETAFERKVHTGYTAQSPERAAPTALVAICAGGNSHFNRLALQLRRTKAGYVAWNDRLPATATLTGSIQRMVGTVKEHSPNGATRKTGADAQRSKVLCAVSELTRTPTCCVNATTQLGHRNQSELQAEWFRRTSTQDIIAGPALEVGLCATSMRPWQRGRAAKIDRREGRGIDRIRLSHREVALPGPAKYQPFYHYKPATGCMLSTFKDIYRPASKPKQTCVLRKTNFAPRVHQGQAPIPSASAESSPAGT